VISPRLRLLLATGFLILICPMVNARQRDATKLFPFHLPKNFDFADFTRFDADAPPKDGIYQSNGLLALQEYGFGGQKVIVPAPVDEAPGNTGDRLYAIEIDSPIFVDSSNRSHDLTTTPVKRHVTYCADRTVYRAAFDDGPVVSLTIYPIYGRSAAIIKMRVERSNGPLHVTLRIRGTGFAMLASDHPSTAQYGSSRWPYRLLIGSRPVATMNKESLEWNLAQGRGAAVILSFGATGDAAKQTLLHTNGSRDLFQRETHKDWNEYLASVPLVIPADPIKYVIGTTGEHETISPTDLVRSELWFWRGVLNTTCLVSYLPATPLMIADWPNFMGMWGNDGVSEAIALAATNRKDLARGAILNWFRYGVNAHGDGTAAWTVFPSGRNTYTAKGQERNTESVPLQGTLVGQYVRMTGDTGILDAKPEGVAGDRTLWQALVAYQQKLRSVRDINNDHLIDWTHVYETGWDDKNSPFVDRHRTPTSAINEQVFNLWSLEEMAYLSRLRGADPLEWETEFAGAKKAIRDKLWDSETQRYWDLDLNTSRLWTQGENLDAYYFLYYESDPNRVAAMMRRLDDPAKFNGPLLPTLAFDAEDWGGYWRGSAWPREHSYVALALSQAGQTREAFEWLARAIHSNIGPILPETIDPKKYPHQEDISDVRIMGYDAFDTAVFPEVSGLQTWGGRDLTIRTPSGLGKIYIRGQKWMGDSYDVLFDPGHRTRVWRNRRKLGSLAQNQVWQVTKTGDRTAFHTIEWPNLK
jgi:hypothetical protein